MARPELCSELAEWDRGLSDSRGALCPELDIWGRSRIYRVALTADFTQKLAGGAGPLKERGLSEDGLEGGEAPFGRSGTQSRQGGTLVDFRLRSPKVFTRFK